MKISRAICDVIILHVKNLAQEGVGGFIGLLFPAISFRPKTPQFILTAEWLFYACVLVGIENENKRIN